MIKGHQRDQAGTTARGGGTSKPTSTCNGQMKFNSKAARRDKKRGKRERNCDKVYFGYLEMKLQIFEIAKYYDFIKLNLDFYAFLAFLGSTYPLPSRAYPMQCE